MTGQKSTRAFAFEGLRRAVERKDAEALVGLYADAAELSVVNRNSTQARPSCCAARKR